MAAVGTAPSTLLHNPLTLHQQVIVNYLTPITLTSLVYILHFASDGCLAIQHLRDENPIYATLTFLLMYSPVIGALFFSLSNVEVWPEPEGFGKDNVKWLAKKIMQHIGFPVWAMYRFAEQLFWSIEAVRETEEKEIIECLSRAKRNSVFELYHFLQAYLQAAPQILFQLHLIFRQNSNFNKATVDMQVFSIIMSLITMSMTTVSYQRFKSHKPIGRNYPWTKEPKPLHLNTIQETYKFLGSSSAIPAVVQEEEDLKEESYFSNDNEENSETAIPAVVEEEEDIKEKSYFFNDNEENSDTEADQDQNILPRKSSGLSITSSQFDTKVVKNVEDQSDFILPRKNSGLSLTSSQFDTKIVKKTEDQPDFILPVKIIFHRGLPEDDAAGKLVSFFWWFCFILPRMLALSAFAYFYRTEIWWLCGSHYIICLGFLLYDAHISDIPYYRAVFILFTAFVYMFCLIEFKIKFKKVRFIYNGFFTLVYLENFIMTSIWYHGQEFIYSDWWYRFIYYIILVSSIISVVSMFFYIFILKPKKVNINLGYRSSKLL